MAKATINEAELRIGNFLIDTDGKWRTVNGQLLYWFEDFFDETVKRLQPIPLTEDLMLKFRRVATDDFHPIEFSKREPKERQPENHYWSDWINEDYKLELSPSYDYRFNEDGAEKTKEIKFWFNWYNSANQFMPLKSIRHKPLKYVHQLQNLFFELSGYELIIN